jgi:hypothetical protein
MDFSGFSLLLPKEAPLTPEQEAQLQALAQTSALNFNAEDIKTTLDTFGHSRAAGFFWVALSDNLSVCVERPVFFFFRQCVRRKKKTITSSSKIFSVT